MSIDILGVIGSSPTIPASEESLVNQGFFRFWFYASVKGGGQISPSGTTFHYFPTPKTLILQGFPDIFPAPSGTTGIGRIHCFYGFLMLQDALLPGTGIHRFHHSGIRMPQQIRYLSGCKAHLLQLRTESGAEIMIIVFPKDAQLFKCRLVIPLHSRWGCRLLFRFAVDDIALFLTVRH